MRFLVGIGFPWDSHGIPTGFPRDSHGNGYEKHTNVGLGLGMGMICVGVGMSNIWFKNSRSLSDLSLLFM